MTCASAVRGLLQFTLRLGATIKRCSPVLSQVRLRPIFLYSYLTCTYGVPVTHSFVSSSGSVFSTFQSCSGHKVMQRLIAYTHCSTVAY